MPKSERYYSQQYSLVDNPAHQDGEYRTYPDYDESRAQHFESESNSLQKPTRTVWSPRKKFIVAGVVAAVLLIIALAVGLGVGLAHKSDEKKDSEAFSYTPSNAVVTSDYAYTLGGATTRDVTNVTDGIGAGEDKYTYYSGNYTQFPTTDKWISFEDMWKANLDTFLTSCENNKHGENNTPEINQQIYDAIQNRSSASHVDHRFILAIIIQESHGCVRVKATDNGVKNPGLMQSHKGHEYDPNNSWLSILAMVQDGTQGTATGDGLVQTLDYYTSPYGAARGYNSGSIPKSGNLSEAAGATACYVSDVANRLTGWVYADSTCHED